MGKRLEGRNYQRQVVPVRVLRNLCEFSDRFEEPVMQHKLHEVVCAKVSKQMVDTINASIARGDYASVSDVVRSALSKHFALSDTELRGSDKQ